MTNPAPDLSRLRIDRDAPPPIRRALVRNVILAIAAICLLGIAAGFLRRGSVVPVQVVVAAASEGGSGAAAAGAT
ncbi:MAG: hypothetical protein AB7I33_16250, partial [Gemmatimonadales bacterium]